MSSIWSLLVGHGTFRSMTFRETGLWADVRELPERSGRHGATPRRGRRGGRAAAPGGVERIVATGNGAAYYVAHALWLASLEGDAPGRRSSRCRAGSRSARTSAGSPATRCSPCPRPASSATWSRSRGPRAGGRASRSPPRRLVARRGGRRHRAPARRVPARGHAHAGARGRVRLRARAVGGGDGRRGAGGAAWPARRTRPRARSPSRGVGGRALDGSARRPRRSSSAAAPPGRRRSSWR